MRRQGGGSAKSPVEVQAPRSGADNAHGVGSTRQAISQHLDVLDEADLVSTMRDGRYKFHFIQTSPLLAIFDRWLAQD